MLNNCNQRILHRRAYSGRSAFMKRLRPGSPTTFSHHHGEPEVVMPTNRRMFFNSPRMVRCLARATWNDTPGNHTRSNQPFSMAGTP